MRRCKHTWAVAAATFAAPPREVKSAHGLSEDFALALVYGLTTVSQRCGLCGLVQSYTTPGDATGVAS